VERRFAGFAIWITAPRAAHAIVRELMAAPPRKQRCAEPSRQEEALRGFNVSP
jgi:hypothetical protein